MKANINEIDYDRDKTDLQAYAIQAYKIAENAIKKNRNFKKIEDKILFKPGEEVLVLKKQNRNIFDYRYEEPFIIKSTDQRNVNLYLSPGEKFSTCHVSQLKRYFRRGEVRLE
uniref:Pol polyprotein n=1 Tax=Strongyloides papillosus TaxID=174720 RepID=A0A0N5BJV7_STREA